VGNTVFTGIVTADNFTTTGAVTAGSITTGNLTSTGSLNLANLTATGTITGATEVSATTLTGTLSTATQNNVTKIGTQTSLSNAGALTQTGAATFATNITQSAGTSALRAVTATSISNSGTLAQTGAATFSGGVIIPQVIQTAPAFLMHEVTNQNVTSGAEVTAKFLATASITQGTTNLTYSNTTGLFTNNSGSSKVFQVSYTMVWASPSASGGRRSTYIRTSNTAGNYPQGASGANQESTTNTAYEYQLSGDTNPIKQSNSAVIMLANGGSFGVYVYQTQNTALNLAISGHILITSL
jgi:hypothetical protein